MSLESGAALALDVGGLILPVVTGAGLLARAAGHADDVARVVSHSDEIVEVATHADEAAAVIRQAENAGELASRADNVVTAQRSAAAPPHGNSRQSTRPQHGYEIYNTQTDDVVKTGISGQPLNQNGTSPRANAQANAWNKAEGPGTYAVRIGPTDMPGRAPALRWEQQNVNRLDRAGHSLAKHKRPRPQ